MPRVRPLDPGDRAIYDARLAAARERRELARTIRDQIAEKRVKNYEIARLIGVNKNTVTRKMREMDFDSDELSVLKAYLGITTQYSVRKGE